MRSFVFAVLVAVMAAAPAMAAEQKQVPAQAPAPAPAAPGAPAVEGEKAALPEMDKLMAYVGTPKYFKAVAFVALGGERDITPQCKEPKALGRAGFTVLEMPSFKDGVAHPVSGLWKDQILVDRCGPKVLHNVLVEGAADGTHVRGLLMPGDTGAPWDWQGDILKDVMVEAMKASGCKDSNKVVVVNTKADAMIEPITPDKQGRIVSGKWREIWTLRACDKPQPVAVTFVADGKGRAKTEVKAEKK